MRILPVSTRISFMMEAKNRPNKKSTKIKEKTSSETKMDEIQKKLEEERIKQEQQSQEIINKPQAFEVEKGENDGK